MKEDRNCGMGPIMYGGAMPIMPGPIPMQNTQMPMALNTAGYTNYSQNQDINTIQNQISSLEQRVTNLENMLNNSSYSSTSYNSTNYQMM
ncbi:MAG: hypothetical protein IJ093_02375 [Bacilli bacterium]|nr:hypothetical protein [Bacilli bacterium]